MRIMVGWVVVCVIGLATARASILYGVAPFDIDTNSGLYVINEHTGAATLIGPLAAVCATWVIAERTYRRRPEALTAIMIAAFAGKLVFFMAYVTVMIRVLSLRPVPFVVSFTTYFIVLYFVVALRLRRLFWSGMHS